MRRAAGLIAAVAVVVAALAEGAVAQDSFKNPVIGQDTPDPGVLLWNGSYYLVHTSGGPPAFAIWQSPDLVNWKHIGYVFPTAASVPSWSRPGRYWAPELHKVGDKIFAYYTSNGADGRLTIGAAYASRPEGPYTAVQTPLAQHNLGAIDPSYFKDPQTGKHFLLWKIDGNCCGGRTPLLIAELNEFGDKVVGSHVQLLDFGYGWEGNVIEGAQIIFKDGIYYLFYSSNYYDQAVYNTGVSRSSSLFGPYTKSCSPILSQFANGAPGTAWAGPGHGTIVMNVGPKNSTFYVYHSWRNGATGRSPGRLVLVDQVWWVDGWPVVGASGTPSSSEQPMPMSAQAAARPWNTRLGASGTAYTLMSYQWAHICWTENGNINNCPGPKFRIRAVGGCGSATINIESEGRPGNYYRHSNGRLYMQRHDGSSLFHWDSSFMALAGLADENLVSFRSVNYPDHYIRHQNGNLVISRWDGTRLMAEDATFRFST